MFKFTQRKLVLKVLLTTVVAGLLCAANKPPAPAPTYTLTPLKVAAGFNASPVCDVNDLGQVVGSMTRAAGGYHAVIWQSASAAPTDLDPGFHMSNAGAINNLGQITGMAKTAGNRLSAVVWIPNGQGGYNMIDVAPNYSDGCTVGINNFSMVLGSKLREGTFWEVFLIVPQDADGDDVPDTWFRDTNGDGENDLMLPIEVAQGGWEVDPFAINDAGWVVGFCDPGWEEWIWTTFLIIPDYTLPNPWFKDDDQDGFNDLAILFSDTNMYSYTYDINNQGQIVDGSRLWNVDVADDGTVTLAIVPMPPPSTSYVWTGVKCINDLGQVGGVGRPAKAARNPDYEPFMWQAGKGTVRLESLVNMTPFSHLGAAVANNNLGQIIGDGTTSAGKRGYVATPVK